MLHQHRERLRLLSHNENQIRDKARSAHTSQKHNVTQDGNNLDQHWKVQMFIICAWLAKTKWKLRRLINVGIVLSKAEQHLSQSVLKLNSCCEYGNGKQNVLSDWLSSCQIKLVIEGVEAAFAALTWFCIGSHIMFGPTRFEIPHAIGIYLSSDTLYSWCATPFWHDSLLPCMPFWGGRRRR